MDRMDRRTFLKASAGLMGSAALPWPAAAAAAATDEFARLDATAQAELVRSGQVQPIELVDAAIARIEALDPKIGAFVTTFFDRARDTARGTLPQGPFAGVPYAIKDLSDFAGTRTTMGSKLFAETIATDNTPIVQRAIDAGLVVLGKTNTPEFGLLSSTEPQLFAPARNPWNLAHSTAALERRRGGGGGLGHASLRAGERRRRVDPAARVRMRRVRPQTLARPDPGGRAGCCLATSRCASR